MFWKKKKKERNTGFNPGRDTKIYDQGPKIFDDDYDFEPAVRPRTGTVPPSSRKEISPPPPPRAGVGKEGPSAGGAALIRKIEAVEARMAGIEKRLDALDRIVELLEAIAGKSPAPSAARAETQGLRTRPEAGAPGVRPKRMFPGPAGDEES
ncbi:MAG: hypothetical protein AB1896_14790 [Thermodesulfobacteriota bacterium]